MRFSSKMISLSIVVIFVLMGCMTNEKKEPKELEQLSSFPSCMRYNDKTYWEYETIEEVDTLKEVGKIKDKAKKDDFPLENNIISANAWNKTGDIIYENADGLYLKDHNRYHHYVYKDHMELGEGIAENPEAKKEVPVPNMMAPHVIVHQMRYSIYPQNIRPSTIPNGIKLSLFTIK